MQRVVSHDSPLRPILSKAASQERAAPALCRQRPIRASCICLICSQEPYLLFRQKHLRNTCVTVRTKHARCPAVLLLLLPLSPAPVRTSLLGLAMPPAPAPTLICALPFAVLRPSCDIAPPLLALRQLARRDTSACTDSRIELRHSAYELPLYPDVVVDTDAVE